MTDQRGITRRDLLRGAGAFATGIGSACLNESDGPPEGFRLAKCEGGMPLAPMAALAPIDHIVVLMMENRSFDHMFGSLSLEEGRDDVDGLKGGERNPGPDGKQVESFHLDATRKLHKLPHEWDPMHAGFNGGKMDGFVMAHHDANKSETNDAGPEVMGFLRRADAPVSYALADNYTLCDRWFCSVMGPTWPNRFFMHAASSGGRKTNHPKLFLDSIWEQLDDADLRGVNYFSDLPWAAAALGKVRGFSRLSSFFEDAAEGALPDFSIIDPGFFSSTSDHPRELGGDSDHPEMGPNVSLGQLLISTIYNAIAHGPAWNRTLFVVTYDESGGFFDHVPPPLTVDERAEFRQLGFRVPGLVIGPHVRRGCINNTQFEHSSIAATIAAKWGLDPLNDRVAASMDLSSCISPELIDNPQAPITLPKVDIPPNLIEKLELHDTQPELRLAADNGQIPAELDDRRRIRANLGELVSRAREFDLVVERLKAR
ncbi:MAG TPA: alkaline phosphatase family protein [Nannocystaceae bacterium]|nr:alkaline phosphatase family protein [Nannocystaceae bacterium]